MKKDEQQDRKLCYYCASPLIFLFDEITLFLKLLLMSPMNEGLYRRYI